jgi:predicted TIM-barrel fold metal-dependent hydrolase
MIDNEIVMDAVVHPYDLGPANRRAGAEEQLELVFGSHLNYSDSSIPDSVLSRAEFFSDFDAESLAFALFAESDVDIAVLHALPNLGFTNSWLTDPDRVSALRDRYPGRFLVYATVDARTAGEAIGQLERQARELRPAGLKLYPSFFYEGAGHGWRLDDSEFATPLLEAARDLGIRNVAIHKALPVAPAPPRAFRVEDLDEPLARFADMNFCVVHAGMAFLDETCALLGRHRNLYATLESTFAFCQTQPETFAEVLGAMLAACGPDQLLFGSGANLMHPRSVLAAFERFELPGEILRKYGIPPLDAAARRKILGGNCMRIHGLSREGVLAGITGDAFAAAREEGPRPYWSRLRAGARA